MRLLSYSITYGFLLSAVAYTQSLALSSANGSPGGQVTLNLSLNSPAGSEPAEVQWTIGYPAASIASVSGVTGAALTSSGKSLSCNSIQATYICVATGQNTNIIANGVVGALTFTLTAGAQTSNVTVVNPVGTDATGSSKAVTATGGTITVNNTPPPLTLSSVSCNPSSVTGGSPSTCTATLSGTAPNGGASVNLTSANTAVASVPASVTVVAGASTANFTANTSAVNANTNVTLTGSYGGTQASTSLTVNSPAAVTLNSLTCNPSSVVGGVSTTCTASLSGNATNGGAVVSLKSGNAAVSVPGSVTIAAGTSSANFTATSSSVTASTAVTLTATYSGVQKTTAVTVNPSAGKITVSSVTCTPLSLTGGLSATCTVKLSGPAPARGALIAITGTGSAGSVPTSATVAAGASSANFGITTYAVATKQTLGATATYNGSSAAVTITIVPPVISSIACSPATLGPSGSATCLARLTGPVPTNTPAIWIQSSNAQLSVPSTINPAVNAQSASFVAKAAATITSQSVTISTDYFQAVKSTTVTLSPAVKSMSSLSTSFRGEVPSSVMGAPGISPASLSCSPKLVRAGGVTNCDVTLSTVSAGPEQLNVSVSEAWAKAPQFVFSRPNQTTLSFQVAVDPSAPYQATSIQATSGSSTVEDFISVVPSRTPITHLPGNQPGLSSSEVMVAAASAGVPIIDRIQHLATGSTTEVCTSGSPVSVEGKLLSRGSSTDFSGSSLELAGTSVTVNDIRASVLSVSPTRVVFSCPQAEAGSSARLVVRSERGSSASSGILIQEAAPGIVTLDGSSDGQAAATILDGSFLAMPRNHRYLGEPAQPGDVLSIPVVGLGPNVDKAAIFVSIGGVELPVEWLHPGVGVGVTQIGVKVPRTVGFDDAAALAVHERLPAGRAFTSNSTTVATEPVRQ